MRNDNGRRRKADGGNTQTVLAGMKGRKIPEECEKNNFGNYAKERRHDDGV